MDPEYGQSSAYADLVSQIVNRLGVTELLDYGCGKAGLFRGLKVAHDLKLQAYDPGLPAFAGDPVPMQMVTCIDVLEHVEPECLDAVLDDLKRVTGVVGFIAIEAMPEDTDMAWWLDRIMKRFDLHTLQVTPAGGFYMIVYEKPSPMIDTVTMQ